MKLEAGKTYVFKDDAAMDFYIANDEENNKNIGNYYRDGFKLDRIDKLGCGYINTDWIIDGPEIRLFKEKESKPFDISEYEFSDKELENGGVQVNGDKISLTAFPSFDGGGVTININLKDAEAIAWRLDMNVIWDCFIGDCDE